MHGGRWREATLANPRKKAVTVDDIEMSRLARQKTEGDAEEEKGVNQPLFGQSKCNRHQIHASRDKIEQMEVEADEEPIGKDSKRRNHP